MLRLHDAVGIALSSERAFHATLCGALGVAGLFAGLMLLLVSAPYGRYFASNGWGPLVMEAPNLVIAAACLLLLDGSAEAKQSPANLLLLAAFVAHYVYRAIIYPALMHPDASPMPLSVMLMAFAFCCANGYAQARDLTYLTVLPPGAVWRPSFLAGAALWAAGFAATVHADRTLRALRRPGEGRVYRIPRGGLFELVSAPHYLGEIVEWAGFALAAGTLPALTFALFTACNIGPRALQHHAWYRRKFEDYPRQRRALIPFVL